MKNRLLWGGGAIAGLVLLTALVGPALIRRDPTAQDILARTRPPSSQHPFGTDRLGRDVFARVVYGARIALLTGGLVAVAALAAGLATGTVTAYYGGRVDALLMRGIDVFMSFPGILVAISVMAVLGQGLYNMILALVLVQIPRLVWVVRSAALQVRERDFVQAMRAVGARDGYIMWRHIVPNCLAPVAVQVSLSFVEAVRTEATLSFLGLGVPPPAPSWGNMLDDGRVFLQTAPWMVLFPAGALALTILGMSLLGDGLRDALDPKLRSH
ncbi:MAG TPA: ABC transporter permease [Candidatus Bathyarchaeia archaeon]|nr:ABC transporter permease [Candidatus Bathyarchaeia archaeon]